MKTLADYLGLPSVEEEMRQRAETQGPVTSEPEIESDDLFTARAFARNILNSREYRQSLKDRIQLHELPAAVEVLLYHYACGKPIDKLEVEDKTDPTKAVSLEQLKARAQVLQNLISQLEEIESEAFVTPHSRVH